MAITPETLANAVVSKKPRQLTIELDPDAGFPVRATVQFRRVIDLEGVQHELPATYEPYDFASEGFKTLVGEITAESTKALIVYQQEVQRLAQEIEARLKEYGEREKVLVETVADLRGRLAAYEMSFAAQDQATE